MQRIFAMFSVALVVAGLAGCEQYIAAAAAKSESKDTPKGNQEEKKEDNIRTEIATFAAGCFWGVEATFRQIKGVKATAVGYTGGHMDQPTYKDVCTDTTGHAEAVQVEYDPTQVSYQAVTGRLLEESRSDDPESAGAGSWHAVPLGHFLPLAGTEGVSRGFEAGTRQERQVPPSHCHRDRSGHRILEGGGLSPAVSGEPRVIELLLAIGQRGSHRLA
jgi:hypothetical protein